MITKNLIVDQLPECGCAGQKPIRGLFSLNFGTKTAGCVRVFNVSENLLPLSIALSIGTQKFVFRDVTNPQNYEFSLPNIDFDAPITMLLTSQIQGKTAGLALATSAQGDPKYAELFQELNEQELDEVIDEEIAKNSPELDDFLDDNAQLPQNLAVSQGDESSQAKPDDHFEPTGNFYSLIQPQLDELFSKFPHFKELEELVANTEWVKVNYTPNDEQHYILGKLYDGETVTHICYGIPATSHSATPPASLADYCQWLPVDLNNVDGAGYWVMYQSAETGENARI